jgi:hydroxyacylglutathione hydrolase
MRAIKNLVVFAVIVAVIGGGAAIALRFARKKPSAAETIKPNLVSVSAASMYLFAARVGAAQVILFDTGADPEAIPVDTALAALGAKRGDVSHIFLTHGHADHAAGAAAFGSAKVHLGASDVPLAEKKVSPDTPAGKVMVKVLSPPAVTATVPLTGATTVKLGEAEDAKTVKALPAPGHTPGSYIFLYDDVLFAGDAMVFKQGRLDRGPKIFDSNSEEGKATITALKKLLEGVELDRVCTGHGGCTPKGLGKNLLGDFISRLGG